MLLLAPQTDKKVRRAQQKYGYGFMEDVLLIITK